MFTNFQQRVYSADKGYESGRDPLPYDLSKLNGIVAESGIQCPVFVVAHPGTTLDQVNRLPGFIPDTDKPIFSESKRSVIFKGMFDTAGTNLLDSTANDFVKLIEGPIEHQADI
jgi:hypothetical protein